MTGLSDPRAGGTDWAELVRISDNLGKKYLYIKIVDFNLFQFKLLALKRQDEKKYS